MAKKKYWEDWGDKESRKERMQDAAGRRRTINRDQDAEGDQTGTKPTGRSGKRKVEKLEDIATRVVKRGMKKGK